MGGPDTVTWADGSDPLVYPIKVTEAEQEGGACLPQVRMETIGICILWVKVQRAASVAALEPEQNSTKPVDQCGGIYSLTVIEARLPK